MNAPEQSPALVGHEVTKHFARGKEAPVNALEAVSFAADHATLTALVGPDGAGKTTLLRLAAGLMTADGGTLHVLGIDVSANPQSVQDRISYMPQRFGLYEDLSVQENLDLYADLHGVSRAQRSERYPRLMEMTALAPFRQRLAGKLSGGMKQKLGLACTLVRSPALLLLDEPTVGVDPLSRRELWEILHSLVDKERLSVVVSTSYMDEAEHCAHVIVLHEGRTLAAGSPDDIRSQADGRTYVAMPVRGEPPRRLQLKLAQRPEVIDAVPHAGQVRIVSRAGELTLPDDSHAGMNGLELRPVAATLEDGFMVLLRESTIGQATATAAPKPVDSTTHKGDRDEVVIEVRDLVRKFGDFTAVDRVSFEVRRGEVFGLLGPNGAGKTTTFRMLCGLLPATSGTLRVVGADLRHARAEARQRIGYVAQKFSLYRDLNVRENLEFFAGTYGLLNSRLKERLAWALRHFELEALQSVTTATLPGGFQRRLAMAAALLHEPEVLFLDEPTSGADPLARREFWARITALADAGTTVIVTTHFMEEAEYCDRIMIQDAGRMLAMGAPAEVRKNAGADIRTMEEAFIAIVEKARQSNHGAQGAAA